jgi:hypothetical protein
MNRRIVVLILITLSILIFAFTINTFAAAILLISFQLNRLILLPHMKDNIPTTVTDVTASGLVFERRVIKDVSLFLFNQ